MHVGLKRAPFALILAVTLASSYLGTGAIARAGDEGGDGSGPPPSVARLADVEGSVGVKHGDAGEQGPAAVNAPLLAGDYLTTGGDGRAEVQLDANTIVRAGAQTQLRFTRLDGQSDVAQIAQGSIELRVLQNDADQVQVETPSVDIEPSEAGAYLITVRRDGSTEVTTRSGSLAVVTPKGSEELDPGRTMLIAGAANDPHYQYEDEVAMAPVEQWGDQRDQQILAAENDPNVPEQVADADIPGVDQLSQDGQWVSIPGYGNAWVPNGQSPSWTPYSDGSWAYEPYYGYTWVAAEPWGWAPYHYGRWAHVASFGWAWVPGPAVSRPMWSPALVAFFGYGGGGIGAGSSNVGWVPLAPGEAYRPWYGYGNRLSLNAGFNGYRNHAYGYAGVSYNAWSRGNAAVGARVYARAEAPAGWQRFSAERPSYAQPQGAYTGYEPQRSFTNGYSSQRSYGGYASERGYAPARGYASQRSYQTYYRGYQPASRGYSAPRQSYQARQSYSRSSNAHASSGDGPHGSWKP